MSKLRSTVHVVRTTKGGREDITILGPDDEIPGWAEPMITNPDAWAEPPAGLADADTGSGRRSAQPATGSTPTASN